MSNKKEPGKSPIVVDNSNSTSEERRNAVRNILAGSGIVAGAATANKWSKPLIDSIILPAHAQTSAVVMLVGNVSVTPTVTNTNFQKPDSILDFFIAPANAVDAPEPDLAGACMTMTVDGSSFTLLIEFADAPNVQVTGSVSGGAFSGSNSGVTVNGNVDLSSNPQMATGTISNSAGSFGFSLDTTQTACTPIAATTTTVAPTTTMGPTTTTMGPTTTTMGPTTTTCQPGYGYDVQAGYCVYGFTTTPLPVM